MSSEHAPLFTIEHSVEIPGTPDEAWAVLVDFAAYGEWNPYSSGDWASSIA